ncbi:Gfo/Idh/MocA family protein [Paracnuella aquatica]|uniref:Gfo/Idh/MocA family protein n=1 Tax=Paracnuella aquatica TaxID=2268757 RepID=UPI000F4F3233|nr:Gfo/Idh/MocA family oxidoreductase [Paracnuella aquatica]RPD51133.1 gfo/Idh/MocA family oxidoreductase [Paracnuella aquatica]
MFHFAIIGCGRIAWRHAEQIARVGKLVAVCDVVAEKAEAFATRFGAKAYTSIDELLQSEKGVQVVVVCTPNGLHAEHTIKSLQGGRHVLCEKPMCLTKEAAYSMRDTAHFFRRQLFIVKQNRFNPPVQVVKELLDKGALGKILSFSVNGYWNRSQDYYAGDWRGTQELDGGILYTQFSHFIDLLIWLLGDVITIDAKKKNWNLRQHFELEDTFLALLETNSGAMGTVHFSINSFGENKEGSIAIIGTKGTVKIGGQYLNTLDWNTNEMDVHTNAVLPQNPANQYGFYAGSMSNHHLVFDELQKALNNMPHQLPSVSEAIKTVETIDRLYKAASE